MGIPELDYSERDRLIAERAAAQAAFEAGKITVADRDSDFINAEAAVSAAVQASITGEPGEDPDVAHERKAKAKAALDRAVELQAARALHVTNIEAKIARAKAEAHGPRVAYGKSESIASAEDFQRGLSIIAAAVRRKELVVGIINEARAAGYQVPFEPAEIAPILNHWSRPQPLEFTKLLSTPDAEAAKWSGV